MGEDLRKIRTLFSDSLDAIEYAYGLGVPRETITRTSSPAVLLSSGVRSEPVEKGITPDDIARLGQATCRFSSRVFTALKPHPSVQEYALSCARTAVNFQKIVFKAMCLREIDFQEPAAVTVIRGLSSDDDRLFNTPWGQMLARNPHMRIIDVPASVLRARKRYSQLNAGLFVRLAFEDWQSIGYRLFQRIWRVLPVRPFRGTVFVLRENSLLKETALHLCTRGFGIRSLQKPVSQAGTGAGDHPNPWEREKEEALRKRLDAVVENYLGSLMTASAVQPLKEIFFSRILEGAREYESKLRLWRDKLSTLGKHRPRAIVSNIITGPGMEALFKACCERSLPLVMFQHGGGRELGSEIENLNALFEANGSHLFFAFNQHGAEVTARNIFSVGRSVSVGMPAEFWRMGRLRRRDSGFPPVLFVSMRLYMGNIQYPNTNGITDFQNALYELKLIEDVLSRLPHQVLYKPYQADRYTDPDPVFERMQQFKNIVFYDKRIDLRYLIPNCKVLVTSQASSTIAWCVGSGKPVVFIDDPHQSPLWPEVREAFQDALFLFDASSPGFYRDLAAFLSQPIEEIERQYATKAVNRRALIDEYFGSGGPGAGKRAAQVLISQVFRDASGLRSTDMTPAWEAATEAHETGVPLGRIPSDPARDKGLGGV